MKSSSSSSIKLILIATMSASVLALPYEYNMIPQIMPIYDPKFNIEGWRESAFNTQWDYPDSYEYSNKIDEIVNFSKNVIENSIDIDNEFVEIVNKNFWDLI